MNQITNNIRGYKMKRLMYVFAMLSLLVIGCSEQSSVFAPENNNITTEPNWIALPSNNSMSVNADVSVSRLLYGLKNHC